MSQVEKPQTWYVYTYSFPDDTVFYVGKGTGNRINNHEDEAVRGCDCRKCITIREIWASGMPIKKRIVFETLIEKDALVREEELIQEYSSEHLTNVRTTSVPKDNKSKQDAVTKQDTPPMIDPFRHILLFRAFPQMRDIFLSGQIPHGMTLTFDFAYNTGTGQVSSIEKQR